MWFRKLFILKGEFMSESIIEAKSPENNCVKSSDDICSNTYISFPKLNSPEDSYDMTFNIHPDHIKAFHIESYRMWWMNYELPNGHYKFSDVVFTLSERPGKSGFEAGRGLEITSTGWGRWRKTFPRTHLEHMLKWDCSQKAIIVKIECVTNNNDYTILMLRPQRCSHSNDGPTISGSADVGIESGNMPDNCKANTNELVIPVDDDDISDS
jgi:hypothetical protein